MALEVAWVGRDTLLEHSYQIFGEGCLRFLTVGELEDAEPVFVVKRVEFHKKIKFTSILGQI